MYISIYYNTKIHYLLKKTFIIYNNIIPYKYIYFKNIDHRSGCTNSRSKFFYYLSKNNITYLPLLLLLWSKNKAKTDKSL